MENKHSIFGYGFDCEPKPFSELFDKVEDDGAHVILVSKEQYAHDGDDGLSFRYRYVVDATDLARYGGEDTGWHADLWMLVEPGSLAASVRASVADCCGIDPGEVTLRDELDHGGCGALMGVHDEASYEGMSGAFDLMAHVVPAMDRLRGYHLDGFQNRIGCTGWDYLKAAVKGGDPTDRVLAEYRASKGA